MTGLAPVDAILHWIATHPTVFVALLFSAIAAFLAGKDTKLRLLAVGFLSVYLLSIPLLLTSTSWYWDCITIEVIILVLCGVCFQASSIAVAKISVLNILLNLLAMAEPYEGPWTVRYREWIPVLEVLQSSLLVLYTPFVCRYLEPVIVRCTARIPERKDTWTPKLSNYY
jgi:hypothetical protein